MRKTVLLALASSVTGTLAARRTLSPACLNVMMQSISFSPPRTTFGWLSSNGIRMFLAEQ